MAKQEPIGEIELCYPATIVGNPPKGAAIGRYYVTRSQIVVVSGHVLTGERWTGWIGGFPKRFQRRNGNRIPFDMRGWQLSPGWRKTVKRDVATCSE